MSTRAINARLERLEKARRRHDAPTVPTDPLEFFELALGKPPIEWQVRFLRTEATRILLNLSRQAAKSTTCAIYAIYYAIHNPDSLILIGAPGTRQSSELLSKARRAYLNVGSPLGYEGDSQTRLELSNHSRIVALPASPDLIRGFSAPSVILLDEMSRLPQDEEYFNAITPMMSSNPSCRLVGMSTPAGPRGVWWRLWTKGGPLWERYEATADDIPWITDAFLAEERERMSANIFMEEYYCEPFASGAAVFDRETIQGAIRPEFNAWQI